MNCPAALLLILGSCACSAGTWAGEQRYQPPRLADGRPDLQGMWIHSNGTPLERPPEVQSLSLSSAEARAIEERRSTLQQDPRALGEPLEYFDERHIEAVGGTLRSSLIVDPSDGRIPATNLLRNTLLRSRLNVLLAFDGPEQRPAAERCLGAVASQPPMLSTLANNLHQIVQTSDTILIASETNHEARIIRMNRQHLPAALHFWLGDSIGWWDGDTLVVETKHFTPSDQARLGVEVGFVVSPQTTVIERFRSIAADELSYSFSIEDPAYYTQRWSAESHLLRSQELMHEFACHEGNYSLRYILEAARVRDLEVARSGK